MATWASQLAPLSRPDQAPPCCVSVLGKQNWGAAVLVLLIWEFLQVRSPNRVSVIVGGLKCFKQRNQTKRFLRGEDLAGWSLPHWWYIKQRIANLLYGLDVLHRCSSSPRNYRQQSQYSDSDSDGLGTLWYVKERQRKRSRSLIKLFAI